ncbi:discoidin domain-containing protein [Actinokineospora pegani]|uniref:discoidin domain-containing protein n=1 Tax=Actinokineospora pegani TaxID=2654637 RepID=UPI0012EAE6A7|nr:discoidin domain-containing protein [Actinokineospora pegani]
MLRTWRLTGTVLAGVLLTPMVLGEGDRTAATHEGGAHPAGRHVVANAQAMIPTATKLPRTGWTATATSGTPAAVLDGSAATLWESAGALPQSITLDLRRTRLVSGLAATPRAGGGRGAIGRYEVRTSLDGTTWGDPVAAGTHADDAAVKTMSFAVTGARFVRLTALTEAGGRGPYAAVAELNVLGDPGAPVPMAELARAGWTATASDQETSSENGAASNVLDGDNSTIWHSRYSTATALPHSITLDLKQPTAVGGLLYRPRPSGANGRVGEYRISVSTDGANFDDVVSSGVWPDVNAVQDAGFSRVATARYVRLTALTEAGGRGPWTSAAEISLLGPLAGVHAPITRAGWTATAAALVDNDLATTWRGTSFTVDMKRAQPVSSVVLTPTTADRVGAFTIATSTNGTTFSTAATGTWAADGAPKAVALTANARYLRLTTTRTGAAAEVHAYGPPAEPVSVGPLPRDGWTATASDQETAGENGAAANVLDGGAGTIWHSKWTAPAAALPHWIALDMKAPQAIAGVQVLPRGDSGNGNIGQYRVETSLDGTSFTVAATGSWPDSTATKTVRFPQTQARHVRLTALTEAGGRGPWTSAAEIDVLAASAAPDASKTGLWGATIGFPIVPVASALLPGNKLLTWSAYQADNFGGSNGYTQTAIMDLTTGEVTQRRVDNTGHDMFCPGISLLADGRVLVAGGSDAQKASIYDPVTNAWTTAAPLNTARGYQSQTTLSNGDVFTVGGSWSGGEGGKVGEVYSPASDSWRTLSGVRPEPFATADPQGVYRADNHTWLFTASGGRVFHAGPSKRMHWVSTTGSGSVTDAGPRGDSADAMNGNAVMYDVGKILTVGGAPAYQDSDATARAYTVDVSTGTAQVTRVGDLAFARAFATGVVLPDGSVLVIGGQARPVPFSDQTAALTPELWDPATGQFTRLAPMAVPRTYHSVANLLPDGRVFAGGGGLCGACATNHLDGQILTPPYLLNADGTPKPRPVITSAPATTAHGAALTVGTDRAVTGFSLVRVGSVTHTVDTDQRRVPLVPTALSATSHQVTVPADPGVAPPGRYLLFALDANGVPSVAKEIRIG